MSYNQFTHRLEQACDAIDGETLEDKTKLAGRDRTGAVRESDSLNRMTCFVEDKGKIEAVGEKDGSLLETRIEGQHVNTTFENPVQIMDQSKDRILVGNIQSGNNAELTRKTERPASRNAIRTRKQRVGRQGYQESRRRNEK